MNCLEFERILPDVAEGGHTPEQQAHLNSCPACSGLVADLNDIVAQAKMLADSAEPSPSVWNALEAQLRREGIIRRAEPGHESVPWLRRWRMAWLVPVAAALAIVAGLKLYHPSGVGDREAVKHIVLPAGQNVHMVSSEDQQFLNTVAARRPARRDAYRAEMDNANAFIRDAQESLKSNPGDVYAQQMLMNAYEQKQMLYDLVVDRSSGQ